jgi:hypothetical protein
MLSACWMSEVFALSQRACQEESIAVMTFACKKSLVHEKMSRQSGSHSNDQSSSSHAHVFSHHIVVMPYRGPSVRQGYM